MRRARPTFVIEYKGGRRQKQPLKNSIWGDTDFKSLALEIEPDLGHVPGHQAADASTSGTAVHERISYRDDDEDRRNADAHPRSATIGGQPDGRVDQAQDGPKRRLRKAKSEDGVQLSQELPSTRFSDNESRSKPDVADRQHTPASEPSEDPRPAVSDGFVTHAALAALDVENIRLRNLLARKLEGENLWLRAMLKRRPT